jgi:hypothetical protein
MKGVNMGVGETFAVGRFTASKLVLEAKGMSARVRKRGETHTGLMSGEKARV